MKLLITSALATIYFVATGQTLLPKKALTFYPGTYIDTECRYNDGIGIALIIQNSVRKGGRYTDPAGEEFFYAIYWYRIINETSTALALTITFPADSFPMSPSEDSYLKVFLPPDTMTLAKEGLHNYGATELNSFLDRGVHKSTGLEKTINPKEACLFYIGGLLHNTSLPARAELFLKGQDLFYRIGGMEIPCGHIDIKN